MTTLAPNGDAEVKIAQQGDLIIGVVDTTPAGTGWTSVSLAVPTGKKWVLKMINTTNNGSMTIVSWGIKATQGGNELGFLNEASAGISKLLENDIVLSAGMSVIASASISAYSSGDLYLKLGYIEFDA